MNASMIFHADMNATGIKDYSFHGGRHMRIGALPYRDA
jgi:hypothetical protein